MRNAVTLGTPGRLIHKVDERFGAHTDCRPCGAGTHAGWSAAQILAHVALHRLFRYVCAVRLAVAIRARRAVLRMRRFTGPVAKTEQQPREQPRLLRRLRGHVNDTVRAIALAVAATDAV